MTKTLQDLPQNFRRKAAELEPYAPPAAVAWREAADAVQHAVDEAFAEVLSIETAAAEFGWSYEGLRRRIAGDAEANAGSAGAPAVTRGTMVGIGRGRGARRQRPGGAARTSDGCGHIIEGILGGGEG